MWEAHCRLSSISNLSVPVLFLNLLARWHGWGVRDVDFLFFETEVEWHLIKMTLYFLLTLFIRSHTLLSDGETRWSWIYETSLVRVPTCSIQVVILDLIGAVVGAAERVITFWKGLTAHLLILVGINLPTDPFMLFRWSCHLFLVD